MIQNNILNLDESSIVDGDECSIARNAFDLLCAASEEHKSLFVARIVRSLYLAHPSISENRGIFGALIEKFLVLFLESVDVSCEHCGDYEKFGDIRILPSNTLISVKSTIGRSGTGGPALGKFNIARTPKIELPVPTLFVSMGHGIIYADSSMIKSGDFYSGSGNLSLKKSAFNRIKNDKNNVLRLKFSERDLILSKDSAKGVSCTLVNSIMRECAN